MRCPLPPPRNLMRWMAALVKIDRPMRVDSTGSLSGGDRLLIVLRSLSRRWPTGSIGQQLPVGVAMEFSGKRSFVEAGCEAVVQSLMPKITSPAEAELRRSAGCASTMCTTIAIDCFRRREGGNVPVATVNL